MGSPVAARAENAWLRSYPFWDAYFAVVLITTVIAMVADGGPPIAVGLVLLLALSYVLVGRKAVRADAIPVRESWWYAASMLVLVTGAGLLESASAIALSALVPMAFMSLRVAYAVVLTAAFFAAPVLNGLTAVGEDPLLILLALAVGLPASALLGTFISRLYQQNRERAELIEELDRTREELAEVSREAGVLAERERLAGDIHDTLAQGFTSIIMLLQAAEAGQGAERHVALAVQTAKENLAETRALIAALAPPALDGTSLGQALRRLGEGFEVPVEVTVRGEPVALPATAEAVLVRVAQEGLANVRKHARARSARLTLDYGGAAARPSVTDYGGAAERLSVSDDGVAAVRPSVSDDGDRAVRLWVSDDGDGFEPSTTCDGYGLRTMRVRVARLGGTVTVAASPGTGTTVTVELPCSPC
ncbi:sensor histidine kinase [Nonomuraea sp. NPDC049750]|uniref:sensor histidine kinase n=1 Tax=Nonomuraea sp. NPDC049750 TaxID=3154738 RepID=UPI0033C37159